MEIDYLENNKRPVLYERISGEVIKFNNFDELKEACLKLGKDIKDFDEKYLLSEFEYTICDEWDNEENQIQAELNKIKAVFNNEKDIEREK